jgi:DNA-binding NtrC family response regulator
MGRFQLALNEAAEKVIRDVLRSEGGNVTRTAEELSVSRRALAYYMDEFGIDPATFRHLSARRENGHDA